MSGKRVQLRTLVMIYLQRGAQTTTTLSLQEQAQQGLEAIRWGGHQIQQQGHEGLGVSQNIKHGDLVCSEVEIAVLLVLFPQV